VPRRRKCGSDGCGAVTSLRPSKSHFVTKRAKRGRSASKSRPVLIVAILALLACGLLGRSLCAQTIEIKLVDGRNGHAMRGTFVNVWVGNARKDAMTIPTDANGVATLRLIHTDNGIDAHNGNDYEASGVVNPVVNYENSFRINVGYVLCQASKPDFSWLAINNFSTEQVLRTGVVSANTCGKAALSPKPSTLVIFVRPLTWWERMKQ
jgi:hypothetical protein